MRINTDLHIHSKFSCDSESSIRDICIAAIEKDLEYICITDHVDFNENDYGCNYYNADAYFNELRSCKEEFNGQLTLLSGLEFSEPHIYKEQFNKLKEYGYDMIIGSIHWLGKHFIGQRQLLQLNKDDIQRQYFEELIEMINTCDIDVVGHLDRPKIILKEMPLITEYIDKILDSILDNNICFEINTRALRKGCSELMPSDWIIKRYLEKGGNRIVVGSDSHNVDEIGMGYQVIYDTFGEDIMAFVGIYKRGKFIRISE